MPKSAVSDTAVEPPAADPHAERAAPPAAAEAASPAITAAGAAVAARSLACVADETGAALQPADCHVLLSAWLDAAAAVAAARGAEGLSLLQPIARLLARKAVQRGDSVAGMADAVRQLATRLAADPGLGRALAEPKPPRRHLPDAVMAPVAIARGPEEFAFHAR